MKYWKEKFLLEMVGNHVASESHIRVQIVDIPKIELKPWLLSKGELLIIALLGSCIISTESEKQQLFPHDQVLLVEGERFSICRCHSEEQSIVQLIWTPGISKNT